MKKTVCLLLSVLILSNGNLWAEFSKADAGTSAAQCLKMGAGARAAGMGEAFTAIVDDSTAIYWNPAGLTKVKGTAFTFMHELWFEGIMYDWVSFAYGTKHGTLGVAVQYLSYGQLMKTDATGTELGDINPGEAAATLSYARKVAGLPIGLNVKYVSAKIENTASAYAVDFGTMYGFFDDSFMIGVAAQNIGTKMKYIEDEEPLPMNIKTGFGVKVMEGWLTSFDINMPSDNETYYCVGTEYTTKPNDDQSPYFTVGNNRVVYSARAGYSTKMKDLPGLNGVTAGFGVDHNGYIFDYALVPFGELGFIHKLSFSMRFDKNWE